MKRFYKLVDLAQVSGGWQVTLDGRGIKTAGGLPQIAPSRELAENLAAEWEGQGAEIDPAQFILRDFTDYALDIVAMGRGAVVASLLRFVETDTLCYQADPEDALFARQQQVWEPLLCAAELRWDIHFTRISGIIHQPQPPELLARMEAVLQAEPDFALAALNTLASLAASLVIGLAALAPDADAQSLWDAANLEEDWQAELWGKDEEALELRAQKLETFAAAMRFAQLSRA